MEAQILSILLETKFLGIKLMNSSDFVELMVRFVFNLMITLVIVRGLYYSISKNSNYLFTYILIGTTVFLLCFSLSSVKLQLGFALGLFAIFGIIRYRTRQIQIKEMTYLFIVIAISVINALANKKISYAELLFTNFAIIAVTWVLEKIWILKHEANQTVVYENIDLIHPDKRTELIADLRTRTGINITRVEIRRINYLRDTANIRIFYYEADKDIITNINENIDND